MFFYVDYSPWIAVRVEGSTNEYKQVQKSPIGH